MPIPGLMHGLTLGLASEVATARKQAREQEDAEFNKQLKLLDLLREDPRTTPELYQRVLDDTLKLHKGQSSTRKPSKGAAGFMGQTETGPYASEVLKSISSGELPVFSDPRMFEEARKGTVEDTLKHVKTQSPFAASAPTPPPPGPISSQAPAATAPQGLSAPPQGPLPQPPGTAPMLQAATGLAGQVAQSGPMVPSFEDNVTVTPPPAQRPQSAFFSPFQMAEMEGNAAGVKAGAISDAQKASLIKTLRDAGASDEEIKQVIMEQISGRRQGTPDRTPGLYMIPGNPNPVEGFVVEDRTALGGFRVLNAQGVPMPPNAVPYKQENDPTSYKEWQRYVSDERTAGREPLTYDKWLTHDANRRPTAGAGLNRNTQGLTGAQQVSTQIQLQDRWRRETGALNTMAGQFNIMQAGLKRAQLVGGRLDPASQAILITFQKILDPGSVVRESEYNRSLGGQPFLDRLYGMGNRIAQGGPGITPEMLADYVKMAEDVLTAFNSSVEVVRAQLTSSADMAGLKPENVFGTSSGLTPRNNMQSVPDAPPPEVQQFLDNLRRQQGTRR